MNTLLQDVKYAVRMLAKAPGFTAIAILTLALGIGANTAIFSVINSVLLEPLPFKNPAQLVSLRETESAPGNFPLDGQDYLDWQAQNKTFSSMSMVSYSEGLNVSGAGEPEVASVHETEANFFDTLGVAPLFGRGFAKGEDAAGKNRVVVLSYGFWKRHFGGDRSVLGKTIELNDESYMVIGVMPAWFNYPAATDIWRPFDMNSKRMHDRGSHWASAIGRIKDGVTIAQARADLLAVSAHINREFRGPKDQDIHALVFPLKDYLVGDSQGQLLILFGAVALVLLVACANVANLLLARSTGRAREMAVRAALGAGKWRLARQLLTESVLLAVLGAALGAIGAWWGVSLLNAAQNSPIPRVNAVQVNLAVLLFTAGVSVLVGILFGLAPALHSSRLDLNEELKSSANAVVSATGSGRAVRNTLIVAEIAVSLALLVGAGLLMRSFARLRSADIGVDPHNVLTMHINLPGTRYKTTEQQKAFIEELTSKIDQIPGVDSSSVSTVMALEGGWNGYVQVPGVTNPKLVNQLVEDNYITPEYFKTFGIPLIQGRTFNQQDSEQAAEAGKKLFGLYSSAKDPSKVQIPPGLSFPAVINQTMAKLFWPKQDPLGKTYTSGGLPILVIGVVGDEKQGSIRRSAAPENYMPLSIQLIDSPGFSGIVSLKTKMAPAGAIGEVRQAVLSLDNTIGVYHVRTMDDVIAENMQDATLQTFLLGAFAALALVLAAVGLYGVMSYLVTQRTHEIGIRMALGAQHGDVLRMVITQGGKLILLGVIIGTAGALGLTRLLSASLFGVTATDPATYIAVAALLAIVALAACYIPARRAAKVDPMVALRYE
ncbi:MAG TPA: ABC transporter permease [Candidatus Acidoferrales bacterium]|nr:ABC transporter permease [Candidatus Acidoferrales bacterium]